MYISEILEGYRRFLCEVYGASETPCHHCDSCESAKDLGARANEIEKKAASYGIGSLSNSELVEVFGYCGGKNFVRKIPLELKINQFKALLPLLSSIEVSSAIELGAATGFLAAFLAKHELLGNCKFAVLDANEGLVEYGREVCQNHGIDMEFHCAYAHEVPVVDESFDLVFSTDLIDCCSNWKAVVREMARVAKSRVVIHYSRSSGFQFINFVDVMVELSNHGMIVDPPCFCERFCREEKEFTGVIISATKRSVVDGTPGLVVVNLATNP